MATKMTMLFQLTTAISSTDRPTHRTGGWSETVYRTGDFTDQQRREFLDLCRLRAALLPFGAAIIGQRYQVVDPPGASSTGAAVYPGTAVLQSDVPQMALLAKAPGVGVRNQRKIELRGIPDARVVEGEYSPSRDFENALTAYFGQLGKFYFKGRDLSKAEHPVYLISADGTMQLTENATYAVNDRVRLLDTFDENGKDVSGVYSIKTVTSSFQFVLYNWGGTRVLNGKVRQEGTIYCQIDGPNIEGRRIVTRKVGRPFDGYRGRASNRR